MFDLKSYLAIPLFGLAAITAFADDKAYDDSYDHKSSGPMVVLPANARFDATGEGLVYLHLAGREYRSGSGWWALRCKDACELIPLSVTVTSKDHARYDSTPMHGQLLQFSPQLPVEGVVAVFKPFRAPLDKLQLKAGPVTSWMPGRTCKAKPGIVHEGGQVMGGELPLPDGQKLVFEPRQQAAVKVAGAQAGADATADLELRMGAKRQLIGNFGFDVVWGEGSKMEPADYVRWVGDLDNDGKPDLIIDTGASTLTLYLSSLAEPGEIAGIAGRFTYSAPHQAGC